MTELILIVYIISLSVLMLFAFQGIIMLYYKTKYRGNQVNKSLQPLSEKSITIQLPVFNEMFVVERLIDAVCKINYNKEKLEIQVLDDSTDETFHIIKNKVSEKSAEGFDIVHIHRADRKGFKAGALREGLKTAKGELIVVFDADFIPNPDFLKRTLPYFQNSDIGMVQTRWEHINEEFSMLTKLQALALNGHFVIEQEVRNKAGLFINFNGTGGIWRRECIEDAGNWQDDTLTEDLDLSYRAQLKGWKFVFLKGVTTPSELPCEINALKAQQFRWTKGAIETARKLLPAIWKSNIAFRIKIHATFHLTSNLVFPFILIAGILNVPLIFIKNSGPDQYIFNYMSIFILAFMSSFLFYLYAQKELYINWGKKVALFPFFLAGSMGLAVNNSNAVIQGLFNKKSEFVRTPKYRINKNDRSYTKNKYFRDTKINSSTFVELSLSLYCLIGVIASIYFIEIAALPFHLMFSIGFGVVAILSFKQNYLKRQGQKT